MSNKIKKPMAELEFGNSIEFPITSLASIETTRARIQKETDKKFSVNKLIRVTRKK